MYLSNRLFNGPSVLPPARPRPRVIVLELDLSPERQEEQRRPNEGHARLPEGGDPSLGRGGAERG